MKARKTLLAGLVGVALVAAFVIVRVLPENTSSAGVAPGSREKDGGSPLPVYTHQVAPRLLQERITATGAVTADEAVEIVSELSGKVTSIVFEEGARVKRGDVLFTIADVDLRAELARAESRVNLARVQADRQNQLVQGSFTSRASYDAAIGEVRVLEAEVTLARAQLAKAEIRAPFDGVVGLRYVSLGAFISSTTRIATLQKLDTIKVEFTIAERHLDRVQPDSEVRISVAGLAEPFSGKVYAIEPRIDAATRTLRLRARAENPGGKALPGGFVTVEIPLREIPDALLVPANALIAGLNEQQVYVLEQGRAQPRKVETGLRLASEVQITSGLEPDAVVITTGQLQLRPGIAVEGVAPAQAKSPASSVAATP